MSAIHTPPPAPRDPTCEGGSWCRCPYSTPCYPEWTPARVAALIAKIATVRA